MRLNKMRLAAAMMSAVMAASTMSTAVFAEDLIVDEGFEVVVNDGISAEDELVEDQAELASVNWDKIKVSKDGKDVQYFDTEDDMWKSAGSAGKAVKVSETSKTCTAYMSITWNVTLFGKEINNLTVVYEEEGLAPHEYDEANPTLVFEPGTKIDCTTGGFAKKVAKCKNCDATKDLTGYTVQVDPKGHDIAGVTEQVEYVVDKDNWNTVLVNGEPVLADKADSGQYVVKYYKVCNSCKKKVYDTSKQKTVYLRPTDQKFAYSTFDLSRSENIRNVTDYEHRDPEKWPASKIVLTNCSKDGYIYVKNWDENDHFIDEYKLEVKAGHKVTGVRVEAKTASDEPYLKVVLDDKTGEIKDVVSLYCAKDIPYVKYEICGSTTCSDKEHIASKTEGVAKHTGAHTPSANAKAIVAALQAGAKTEDYQNAYDDFLEKANAKNSGLKYVANIECEKEGTVTITYLCRDCGAEIKDAPVEVKIGKLEHRAAPAVQENRVEATCSAAGSYDSVEHCKYCNKVLNTVKVTLPKKDHTFAEDGSGLGLVFKGNVVIDHQLADGYGYSLQEAFEEGYKFDLCEKIGAFGYNVMADGYATCTKCGQKEYLSGTLKDKAGDFDRDYAVKIVDLKRGSNGNAGTITLNATCDVELENGKTVTRTTGNVTFPYYNSLLEYIDRNPNNALNGLHLDNDGVYRYYKDGEFQPKFTGIVEFEGGEFFVGNGVLCSGANGLNLYNGTWYMLSAGQIQRGYTGLALYDGEWFYLTNGVLDTNVNKLVAYDGEKFAVAAGRLLQEVNGLWQNPEDGEWYFLALGRAVTEYTGTATYDGKSFELVNGKLVD